MRAEQQIIHRGANGCVGKHRLQLKHPRYRPNPADIGERDQQRRLRLHAPKQAHRFGLLACRCDRAPCLAEDVGEAALGFGLDQRE